MPDVERAEAMVAQIETAQAEVERDRPGRVLVTEALPAGRVEVLDPDEIPGHPRVDVGDVTLRGEPLAAARRHQGDPPALDVDARDLARQQHRAAGPLADAVHDRL